MNATLGFGHSHVAPLTSRFVRDYPQAEVQLQLAGNAPPLTDDSFDVRIRLGALPDAATIAKHIAPNHRVLCARRPASPNTECPRCPMTRPSTTALASGKARRPAACGG